MAKRPTREECGVKEGDEIIIKGNVTFAKLDKLVEGDALVQENKNRKAQNKNMIPATSPFRSIVIEDVDIVKGKGTPLAKFYGEQVYKSGKGKLSMNLESKSPFAPQYAHMIDGVINPIKDPEKNPNKGQEVYVILKSFMPKNYDRLSSSFISIMFPEGPINFYEGGGSGTGTLAGFGELLGAKISDTVAVPETIDTSDSDTVNGFQSLSDTQHGLTDEDVETDTPTKMPNPFDK